jgi:hypothetical protein
MQKKSKAQEIVSHEKIKFSQSNSHNQQQQYFLNVLLQPKNWLRIG